MRTGVIRSRSVRFCLAFLLASAMEAAYAGAPGTVNIHGQVLNSQGQPLSGTRVYAVQFYDAQTEGAPLGSAIAGSAVLSERGLFNISVVLPAQVLTSAVAWYAVGLDSNTPPNGTVDAADWFPTRVKVDSVPFARLSAGVEHVNASAVGSGTVNDTELASLDGVTGSVQTQLNAKAAASNVYTKAEVNASQAAQDSLIANKANASDVFTKTEVNASQAAQDTQIAGKASASSVYTKTEADTSQAAQDAAIAGKADAANVYSKTEVNSSQSSQDTVIAKKLAREGESFVIVEVSDSAELNGTRLRAAYAAASAKTPYGSALSATNRVVVLLPPGQYDLGTDARKAPPGDGTLTLDTQFVDLVGISACRDDQVIFGEPPALNGSVLLKTADDVSLENLTVRCTISTGDPARDATAPVAYRPSNYLHQTKVRNCTFWGDDSHAFSMALGVECYGTYERCTCGDYAFGGNGGSAVGTFIDCKGGYQSFAGEGVAIGTFTRCSGENSAFGARGSATGTFLDCTGMQFAFGGHGTAGGTFVNCTGGEHAFGGFFGTASGGFFNCTGGLRSFGGATGTASGRFENCRMTGEDDLDPRWGGTFTGYMQGCYWNYGVKCGAGARIYNSTFLSSVDLDSTAAGIAHCHVKGSILNTGSAVFNYSNLVDPDVE